LPAMILNVADECSGINHLISLFALAIPLAVLTQRNWWASSLLIGLSIPISLFANSIRVLLLILFNYNQTVFSHGPKNLLYTSSGFFIGLALLFIAAFLLSALTKRSKKLESKPTFSELKMLHHKKLLYLFPILITGALFSYFWRISPEIVIPKDISQLNLSDITITKNPVFPEFDSLPSADIEYKYSVINQTGQQWYIYTGWYEMQRQRKEVSGYWYDRLLHYDSTITFSKDTYPITSFRVCRMKNDTSLITYLIAYKSKFFTTSNPYIVKVFSAFEGLVNRTTSCTIIIIAIPKNEVDRIKDDSLYSEMFKEIGRCLIGSFRPPPPAPSPIRIGEGE
ncbi:MAG: exosortase/archaeosortase family protein, partial [Crenarchaeota archaeon]|nr:exosortase/archaeosortase family protein [Thermoproteota archaeon]